MNRFLQLHLLTSYPPSNLNRDDLGRPKTAMMGGATRLRVSSQSLKRAWRTSELFQTALGGHVGTRSKEKGRDVYKALQAKGIGDKKAFEWAKQIAGVFGKSKRANKDDPLEELDIEQLAHFSPEEQAVIEALIDRLAESQTAPSEDDLALLRHQHTAADIALFGRMLASQPSYNTEAAAQVAHAISVHRVQVEDDFFTAVDDLNLGVEDVGAGHMGETEFGAAVYYLYLCINRELLEENLGGDSDLTARTLSALLECVATIAPTGKQNSFASRAYASYAMAEKGNQQPRSLSVAYLKPIDGTDILTGAIGALEAKREKMAAVYGPCASDYYVMNAETGEGSLAELIAFAAAE
ncbi:type I-E CRISPR-associated protein Cas7/Cse4/CasC [Candidatus Entotheonella palauensis]|uniref:type I-E CRISPR-associated protein Cas7/Cse4/CasC n=1 Tax=Candidatus Entotheonella palauensis TaxID=93172 RepID=UPI000B7E2D07|nr:type I-E CRISPR-associated protein Cas7/Cse4/CasC [Candidatus Entotheonella palauensis]